MSIKSFLTRAYYLTKERKKHIRLSTGVFIGRGSSFEGYNTIYEDTSFSGQIGYASNIGRKCKIVGKVGRYTSIGSNVNVETYTHPTSRFVSTHPCFYSLLKQSGFTYTNKQLFEENLRNEDGFPVSIGNDVWIGSNVTLIGGITIGDGAIIATGAVVTKDVEPFSIVGGIPAKKIRNRFSDDQIDFLLKFKWWSRDDAWIKKHSELFEDIDLFVEQLRITRDIE